MSAEELDNIIHCNTTNALIESENKTMIELQNEQLQHQLAVKDKALDIACHSNISNCMSEEISGMKDYFIEQAEKELKDE